MRALRAVLAASLVTAGAAALGAAPASAAPAGSTSPAAHSPADASAQALPAHPGGTYVAVTPFRAADTRRSKPLAAHRALKVAIGGHGGVPARNVAAVAVTVAALAPTAPGVLTAYPYGAARPGTRSVTYAAKVNTATTVVSRVSATGLLAVYNLASRGSAGVVVDVTGYWTGGTSDAAGTLHPLARTTRVLDTVHNGGALKKSGTKTLALGGRNGVPTSEVGAAFVSITAVTPAASGGLTAVSHGNDPPTPLTMRFTKGRSSTAFAVVPTDDQGRIDLHNTSAGTLQLYVDLVGWAPSGPAAVAGAVQTRFPARVLNGRAVKGGATTSVAVGGRAGVPRSGVSAVLASLTVGNPAHTGGLTAWSGATRAPGTTSLQFGYRSAAANLVLVPVSSTGTIAVRNTSAGSLKLYVDIVGYVPKSSIAAPAASTSRYIRTADELSKRFGDATNGGEGCFDASHGSRFALLQFGAQSEKRTGVLLSVSNDFVSYTSLVQYINAYLASFRIPKCKALGPITVALGTNNDGTYTDYVGAGSDWALKVVDPVAEANPQAIVLGANDIEPSFRSTLAQAQQWEAAYLGATDNRDLIFNGSADGCESSYGAPGRTCAYGWTMEQIYQLAGGSGRVRALPQIYTAGDAAKWTNIYETGGLRGNFFAGVLTQSQVCQGSTDPVCATTYSPQEGWTALYRGLSTVVANPDLPAVTDLRADSD